jgi:hypothetical protein
VPTPDTSLVCTSPELDPVSPLALLPSLLDPQAASTTASAAAPSGPADRVIVDEYLMTPDTRADADWFM